MSVFNSQARIQIGGKWHQVMGRVERPYLGVLAGLVYNEVRVLDDVRDRRPGTEIMGHVNLLDSIPYNYRQLNTGEFDERMQNTETSNSPGVEDDIIVRVGQKCGGSDQRYLGAECFKYSGDGDELITPVYLAPTVPHRVGGHSQSSQPPLRVSHFSRLRAPLRGRNGLKSPVWMTRTVRTPSWRAPEPGRESPPPPPGHVSLLCGGLAWFWLFPP